MYPRWPGPGPGQEIMCNLAYLRSVSHDAGWIKCWGGMAWKFVKAGKRREGGGIKKGV